MNNDDQNQAAKLQQLFTEVTQHEGVNDDEDKVEEENDFVKSDSIEYEIDVLNLPPRSEVHLSKRKKMKLTFNRPLMRFIFVIIILVGIAVGAYYVIGFEQFFSTR